MTSIERLDQLLPMANGDSLSDAELRRRVFRFLHRFEARGLRLPSGEQELWDVHDAGAAELAATQQKVQLLFATGFMFVGPRGRGTENTGPDDIRLPLSFPSLRFAAFHPPRGRQHGDGRYTLMVEAGRLRDLVPYLAMWILATESVAVMRCAAPAYRDWKATCNRFFVQNTMGRPRKVCGDKCSARVKAVRVNEQVREAMKAKKKATKQSSQRKK